MQDPNQQQQQPMKNKVPPKSTGLSGVVIFWSIVAIVTNYAGIIFLIFFSTGDEIPCGALSKQVCTLPGVNDLGYVVLGCGILSAMILSLLFKANKDLQ